MQKRYVDVLDDVWKVDVRGAIEHALPENKGGRIMIISRIKDVADFCKGLVLFMFIACNFCLQTRHGSGCKIKEGQDINGRGWRRYLANLIHRNLVQVSKVYIDGKARSCRVHDLLHEVLRRNSAGSSFYHVLSEDESTFEPVTRRLLIDSSPSKALRSITQSHIRFVFTFNQAEWPKSFLNTWSGNLKLVKVLDFTDAPLNHLPKYVGYLYLLKYLSLRNMKVKLLLESIGNLQNLENLDLKQSLKVKANHGGINLIKALGKLRQLSKA
ncbi:unnamed protein product [Malus baccata var. baccata]